MCSHFHKNQGSGGSGDTTAVTVYRGLLSFYGNNSFYGNIGGGTTLLSSRMDVRGNVVFDGNLAVFGAGVAMSGRSLVSREIKRSVKLEMLAHEGVPYLCGSNLGLNASNLGLN